ncbi:hypothetical protein FA95DRAFT_1585462 [Auriscalpium vulgare]|uniref:Uncharacterized protein n=1 Tax=Auriscalpium vulgare TaxID=40419 RepID=A0ACB8R365_9AGAM|nr:hypothetical protein FA95DRAFT_1585462 [Auriscalpium vulgare]
MPKLVLMPQFTQVAIKSLPYTAEQASAVQAVYEAGKETRRTFTANDPKDQAAATELLKKEGLDEEARQALESRWRVHTSRRWGKKYRVLVQCRSGYSTEARQETEDRRKKENNGTPSKKKWSRAVAYDFTGCLAHADITFSGDGDKHVLRVVGHLQHNTDCMGGDLKRIPAIPLHKHVKEVALRQLKDGSSLTAIQARNIELHSNRQYREQASTDPLRANFRYELLPSDMRSLYRAHHLTQGIDVRTPPEMNIDLWMKPSSAKYRPDFHQSVFLYEARTATNDRFKLCICTPEMEEAAWMYVHESQLILDGTFGLSNVRILVWIAMGITKAGKGVPVVFMLFSAPSGAKATHAAYNTAVITELLLSWKTWMSSRPLAKGRTFMPWMAITDADPKERGALIVVWPLIILLLCLFHLKQSWTNKRRILARTAVDVEKWKTVVMDGVHSLESSLIDSTDHASAKALLDAKIVEFTFLSKKDESKKIAEAGLMYLAYLGTYWMPLGIWQSWSAFGRLAAAARLNVPVKSILSTTNHLESFNGKLKNKEVASAQHSRHRLRSDILCHHLVFNVLPRLFAQLRIRANFHDWTQDRFRQAAGGAPIPPTHAGPRPKVPVAYFLANDSRTASAVDIIESRRLVAIKSGRPFEVWATCATSGAIMSDEQYPRYWLTLHATGSATCTCPDWLQRGGACKHMRSLAAATKLQVASEVETAGTTAYHLPVSLEAANQVRERNEAWYSGRPHLAPTAPLCPRTYPHGYTALDPPPTMTVAASTDPTSTVVLPPPDDPDNSDPQPSLEDAMDLAVNSEPLDEPDVEGQAPDDGDEAAVRQDAQENVVAVELQLQQRTQLDMQLLLPRLYGLYGTLSDMSSLDTTDELVAFHSLIDKIGDRLRQVTSRPPNVEAPCKPEHPTEVPAATSSTATLRADDSDRDGRQSPPRKRMRPNAWSSNVRPLSPESKQERKDSHSIL